MQISEGRGHRPPTTVGVRVAEWLPFRVESNICSASFSFVTIHACDRRRTGRQTDRQNYDSQDRPRICSRGKNRWDNSWSNQDAQCVFICMLTRVEQIVTAAHRDLIFVILRAQTNYWRQDCDVLSVSVVWTELATRQDSFPESSIYLRLNSCKLKSGPRQNKTQFTPHFETGQNCKRTNMPGFEIFCLRQSWFVSNSVHTADTHKTRQDSLVLCVSAVWTLGISVAMSLEGWSLRERWRSSWHKCVKLSFFWAIPFIISAIILVVWTGAARTR